MNKNDSSAPSGVGVSLFSLWGRNQFSLSLSHFNCRRYTSHSIYYCAGSSTMWGVYIQELPALNMAEIITPTVPEAEEDDSEKIVGECEACRKTLLVTDRVAQDCNDWYVWCVTEECEEHMAWQLYNEMSDEMSEQDKKWSA